MFKYMPLVLIIFGGCSYNSPRYVVEQRYENMGVDRDVEVIYKTDNVAVVLGSKVTEKCREVETVALNKFNKDRVWKIVRLHNERDCDLNATNVLKERYLKWKKDGI